MIKLSKEIRRDIFKKGVENELFHIKCVPEVKKRNNTKVILFIMVGIILSSRKKIRENIAWVNGNRRYEKYFGSEQYDIIHHGSFFSTISNFMRFFSVFTPHSRFRRFIILIKSIISFRREIKHFVYWIEFNYVIEFLETTNLELIVTPHVSDRQITWISYYAEYKKVGLEIYQHGVYDFTQQPNKVYCSKFYALDEFQAKIARENIISNIDDCVIEKFNYISVIDFFSYGTKYKIKIGVATLVNSSTVNEMLSMLEDVISKNRKDIIVIIMLHPSDDVRNYIVPNNLSYIIEKEKKYIDIDILITGSSTIIYDYYYAGFGNPILQIDDKNKPEMFESIPNVIHLNKVQEAIMFVERKILYGKWVQ